MSSSERPIGAAKGKQSDTEALCHPPLPLPSSDEADTMQRQCKLNVHTIVEHPNQGDTCICMRTCGLMPERVYGGDIQSIDTDH